MKNEGNNLPMNVYSKDIKEDEKNQSLSDLIVNASLISNESDDVETKMRRLIAERRNKGGEIMAIKVTNKKPLTGNKRSHALNATKMQQKPNLQVVRLEDGTKVRVCKKCGETF